METESPLDQRPALERWLSDRRHTYADAGRELGCSRETVRLICLPFDDQRRRLPSAEVLDRIFAWTKGEVGPLDFYPAKYRPAASAPEAAERGTA